MDRHLSQLGCVAGGVTHQIPGRDFNNLLLRTAAQPEGLDIAIQILHMRLSFDEDWRQSSTTEIIDVGCELIRQLQFSKKRDVSLEYGLGMIARYCLVGQKGAATVREICQNLKAAVSESRTYAYYHKELLQVLLGAQPYATLEALCGESAQDLKVGIDILDEVGQLRRKVFDAIPEAVLLSWCDQQPEGRYPAVAAGVTAFQPSTDSGRPQWTSTALKLLDKAPNRVEVLKRFVEQFSPMGWVGSRAPIVDSNVKLLDDLARYPDLGLVEFIAEEKARLAQAIQAMKRTDTLIERQRDERFE